MSDNVVLLTPREVAARLKVSVRTVQRLVEAKKLKGKKIGSGTGDRQMLRIHPAELERFINAGDDETKPDGDA